MRLFVIMDIKLTKVDITLDTNSKLVSIYPAGEVLDHVQRAVDRGVLGLRRGSISAAGVLPGRGRLRRHT